MSIHELATSVSNDISEGIDNGESRKQLRQVISWWADLACEEAQKRAALESRIEIYKAAKGLMDVALKDNHAG